MIEKKNAAGRSKLFVALALASAVLCLPATTLAQTPSLMATHGNVVAWSDGPVPGMPPEVYFAYAFDSPGVADDGTLFFRASFEGGDVTLGNSRALFRGKTFADLTMVERWGDPAPGLPGLNLINSAGTQGIGGYDRISPDGRTMWQSWLSGAGVTGSNDTAIFYGTPDGTMTPIAREGDPAPGTVGAVYASNLNGESQQFNSINRHGAVLFRAALTGGDTNPTNNMAIWAGPHDAPVIMVRKGGTLAPGLTASEFGYVLAMDNDGRVVFTMRVAGDGVTSANDYTFWLYTPGTGYSLLLREGEPAPGTLGATFGTSLNDWQPGMAVRPMTKSGLYGFEARLVNGDVSVGVNDRAFYVGSFDGTKTLVSRGDEPAPGTDGRFYGYSPYFCYVNSSGNVAIQAQIIGGTVDETNDLGIWFGKRGALQLVARDGDVAPGTVGARFDGLVGRAMMFNDHDQIVLYADLIGGDVEPGWNDRGTFGWDPVHGLYLIQRMGETLQPTPDFSLTMVGTGYNIYDNSDGASMGLGNNGIFATMVSLMPQGQAVVTVDLNCYPPRDWYVDADGDGYGDPSSTPVSVCANAAPPAGYAPNALDCNDANPAISPAAFELCNANGIDDNCDGLIDNVVAPAGSLGGLAVNLGAGKTDISWNAAITATGYDVLAGDLHELLASSGAWSSLTQASCAANDVAGTTVQLTDATPAPKNARWYLVRAVNCAGNGSYDDGAGLAASRDAGIQAGTYHCP